MFSLLAQVLGTKEESIKNELAVNFKQNLQSNSNIYILEC
jgi:hypothetical protein